MDAARKLSPEDLARLILDRRVLRIALMRNTVHLVSARDCLALRPLCSRSSTVVCMPAAPTVRAWRG